MEIKATCYIVAVLILLNGCVSFYNPQPVDIPLIKEKGDVRVDVGYFMMPDLNYINNSDSVISSLGVHGTFSAGLTDNVAIQTYLSLDVFSKFHLQTALGLFQGFENKTVVEMYGGFGYGNGLWGESKNDYFLTFTQFNIGQSDLGRAHIDYGLGLKGGFLFANSSTFSSSTFYQNSGWIFEPSVVFRVGGRRAKYSVKLNYLRTNTIADEYYFPFSVSMGANFRAGKKVKR